MSNKKWRIFFIITLTLTALVGGSAVAMLIYFEASGYMPILISLFESYFVYGAKSVLLMFWVILLPILMLAFLIFTFFRQRKTNTLKEKYEKGIETAIQAEREEFARSLAVNRFGTLPKMTESYDGDVDSLASLCERFVSYAASIGLYFTEREAREFVASLCASHLVLIKGISGAGKTSLAYAFGEFLDNPSEIIPVQPMWKERSDLIGYYNEFTRHYNETPLLRKMYEANQSDGIFLTVLDEVNLARVEYYFAEFLSLMEIRNPELRYLELTSDGQGGDPEGIKNGRIKLPENMWFIGTVNDDDAAFSISDKVYDRATIVELNPHACEMPKGGADKIRLPFKRFVELSASGAPISNRNVKRIKEVDEFLSKRLGVSFGNRIRKQIGDYVSAYVACGGDETEAVDDILAKKVLRKLEYKDVSMCRDELVGLREFILGRFDGKAERCISYLDCLIRRG